MNELPPKINVPPSGASFVKTSSSSGQKQLLLGLAGGLIAGILLASLFWVAAGLIFFRTAHRQPADMPVESVEATDASDNATLAEIDAAAQLNFEQNKLALFNQIAARSNLSPGAQVHLAEAAFKHLNFEGNQLQVLLKLIGNPAFSSAAKEAILKDLSKLNFENNKQSVLDAINRHESQK